MKHMLTHTYVYGHMICIYIQTVRWHQTDMIDVAEASVGGWVQLSNGMDNFIVLCYKQTNGQWPFKWIYANAKAAATNDSHKLKKMADRSHNNNNKNNNNKSENKKNKLTFFKHTLNHCRDQANKILSYSQVENYL